MRINRSKVLRIFLFAVLVVLVINFLINRPTKAEYKEINKVHLACQIPRLELRNPDIDHFFKHIPPLVCRGKNNWVTAENGTFLIDPEAVKNHGSVTCNYENVQRKSDYDYDTHVTVNFPSGSDLLGDFFVVKCQAKNGQRYSNVHASIKPSAKAIEISRNTLPSPESLNLNVYMLGFDSTSRLTFMRKLPKTYAYIVDQLGGIVLEAYNIVGDGTPQALIPMLTGETEEELPLTRKRYENASYVDVYPFVWNDFKRAGYATLFGEDGKKYDTFQYRLKGFDQQPTDHYLRPYYLVVDKNQDTMRELKQASKCISNEPQYKVHFRFSEDMFRNYPRSVRKFAFNFHTSLSHDDINDVEVADEYMVEHLKYFRNENHLNDTVLIFMADHGHRFASFRQTQQGKLEERLPFFSFVFPPWFKDRYPEAVENLKLNTNRLTTPFDIHATLKSLLNFTYPPSVGKLGKRSISLFDEIPANRSCEHAGVPTHWCTCLRWQPISVEDARARDVAEKLVRRINDETERERKLCAKLNLHRIESANFYTLNEDLVRFKKTKDLDGLVPDLTGSTDFLYDYYQLTIRTVPGNALYEASVTWHKKSNDVVVNLNQVSITNRYGDLPHCIVDKDQLLVKWCVCYDKISA